MTKEFILETTTKLFLKNGVKSVTIGDITKELHTSKRTIYNHFIDKEDLIKSCIEAYLADIRSNNDDIINNANNAIEAMGYIHQQILARDDKSNSNFYKDVIKYYPSALKDSYKKNSQFAFRELFYLSEWGIREGLFHKDMNSQIAFTTVQSLLKLCNNDVKFPRSEFSKSELVNSIMIPYLRGLCTDKGIIELEKSKHLYLAKAE